MYLATPRGFLFHALDQSSFSQMCTGTHHLPFPLFCFFWTWLLLNSFDVLSSHTGRHTEYEFWKKSYVLWAVLNIAPGNFIKSFLVAAWERQDRSHCFSFSWTFNIFCICVMFCLFYHLSDASIFFLICFLSAFFHALTIHAPHLKSISNSGGKILLR